MLPIIVFCFFCLIVLIIFLSPFIFEIFLNPSHPEIVEKVMDIAEVKEGTVFYDLGSGDGRVLISAAKRRALTIGYEPQTYWYLVSILKIFFAGLARKIAVRREDFMDINFSEADVFYIFLTPEKIARLEEILKEKAKKGARIITHQYPFPNWREHKEFEEDKIYLYVKQ